MNTSSKHSRAIFRGVQSIRAPFHFGPEQLHRIVHNHDPFIDRSTCGIRFKQSYPVVKYLIGSYTFSVFRLMLYTLTASRTVLRTKPCDQWSCADKQYERPLPWAINLHSAWILTMRFGKRNGKQIQTFSLTNPILSSAYSLEICHPVLLESKHNLDITSDISNEPSRIYLELNLIWIEILAYSRILNAFAAQIPSFPDAEESARMKSFLNLCARKCQQRDYITPASGATDSLNPTSKKSIILFNASCCPDFSAQSSDMQHFGRPVQLNQFLHFPSTKPEEIHG